MKITVHISPEIPEQELTRYSVRLLFFNKGLTPVFVDGKQSAMLTAGYSPENDFVLSRTFHQLLSQNIFSYEKHLSSEGTIKNESGGTDYLGTIFYLVNSVQEFFHSDKDEFGRFRYANSIQHKLGNVKVNFVQQLMDELFKTHPKLTSIVTVKRPAKIFLTHDIDSVYGAIKEDGFYALKHNRFGKILRLIWNRSIGKPDWLNMDQIMKLENEYDFRSTFYWLLKKDKMNSDYDFSSSNIQQQFKNVKTMGWENGLHKSLPSGQAGMSDKSFKSEIKTFGSQPNGNRFHFLRFSLPRGYNIIEESGIRLDSTLGYTGITGFRNSYGLPFMPYNIDEKRVYNLVEVPQLIMDRTFFRERKPLGEIKKELIDFFESNKANCIFTINWHNNFFTELKYGGYLQLYREMLAYFKESGTQHITQNDIINEYYQPLLFTN